jgi:hypothetical protein
MPFPNTKTGFTVRERGRGSFGSLWLAGKQFAAGLGFAFAQGGVANITLVTIQVQDKNANPISGVYNLDLHLSDAATGIGVTAVTASGAVAAGASGTDLVDFTAKKVKRVQTDSTGKYILSITDTAKTGFYVAVANPSTGLLSVSRQLVTGDYK